MPQSENQKIRSRLRSYERKLEKEKKEHGFYRDGAGKRYQIGPHYMLLGDNDGALAAFRGSPGKSQKTWNRRYPN